MTDNLPRECNESKYNPSCVYEHLYKKTRWADLASPRRCNVIVESLNSWTDCEIPFTEVNESWYYFMLDLLNYLEIPTYLFEMWYDMKIAESMWKKEIAVEIADEILERMYTILEDYWCTRTKVSEVLYNYAD